MPFSDDASQVPVPAPRARRLTAVLSGVIALSSFALIAGAVTASPKPAWFVVMFEAMVLVGCAFGVLFGLGRFRMAPQMTILCVLGTVLVGTTFGPVSVRWSLHGYSLFPLIIGRAVLVLVLGATAAVVALGDNREAWRRTGKGVGLLAGFLLGSAAGWWVLVRSGLTNSVHGVLVVAFSIVLYLILTGLLAGAVHLIITAFADALEKRAPRGSGNPSSGSPTTGHEPA